MIRRVSAALSLSLLAALTGCGSTPADEAQRHMKELHASSAPHILVERGRAFAAVSDYTRAEDYFVAAIDAGASTEVTLPLLLDACVRAGKLRVAAQYAQSHLERHPADVETRAVLGTLRAALGDGHAAEVELAEAIRRRPRTASLRYTLAVVLRDVSHDSVSADRAFRDYLRLEPTGAHSEEARESLLRRVEDAAGVGLTTVRARAEGRVASLASPSTSTSHEDAHHIPPTPTEELP